MQTNLHLYHRTLARLEQLLPQERITRHRNLALLIVGIYLSRSIHLAYVVRKWPSRSQEPSLVNRLHRFLVNVRVDVQQWYAPLAKEVLAQYAGLEVRLVIDCTKVGRHHRLLTVGVAYKRRVIPLAWSVHRSSRGHTPVTAQIALLTQVSQLLSCTTTVWVVGDSEFGTVTLLQWLNDQGWHFVIRQKSSIMVKCAGQTTWTKLSQLPLQPGQTRIIGRIHLTAKHASAGYWLVLHWAVGEDEPWYLVADAAHPRLLQHYRRRMWIEQMFGDMKGHGFDLEATHLNDADRIARLFLAICFAFVWLIAVGSAIVKAGRRYLVDHRSRRDKSYFRLGWDWVERCLRLGDPIPIHARLTL